MIRDSVGKMVNLDFLREAFSARVLRTTCSRVARRLMGKCRALEWRDGNWQLHASLEVVFGPSSKDLQLFREGFSIRSSDLVFFLRWAQCVTK